MVMLIKYHTQQRLQFMTAFLSLWSATVGQTVEQQVPMAHPVTLVINILHYKKWLQRSVAGEFNKTQHEAGLGDRSNGSSNNWLTLYCPKVVICPHKADYGDTCSKYKNEKNTKQTTTIHLRQWSNADPAEITKVDELTC